MKDKNGVLMDLYFCPNCEKGFAVDEDEEPEVCPYCQNIDYEFISEINTRITFGVAE